MMNRAAAAVATTDDAYDYYAKADWRIRNIYKITDEHGNIVDFRPNGSQTELLDHLHYLNLILKARQLGFTTLLQIIMLDQCLFKPGTQVGLIAHRLEDAKRIFREKAKFAYEQLDPWIKERVPLIKCNETEMVFANGSSFIVGTSLRSGTYQIIHISEHGKLCAQFPEKAREAKTGALNTVPPGGYVFIESTAEGQHGDFFDFCDESRALAKQGRRLNDQQYRFHFYPWYMCDRYAMAPVDCTNIILHPKMEAYFTHLEDNHGITLTFAQRCWYAAKAATQHEDMKREFPTLPDEAFEAVVEGAIYGQHIQQAMDDGRIGIFAPVKSAPTFTFWDIGIGDHTAIWIVQFLPNNGRRLIASYANNNVGLPHYTNWLQVKQVELGITYRGHVLPHDGVNRDKITAEAYDVALKRITGVETFIMPRGDVALGINEIRNLWPFFQIDELGCAHGLRALKAYQWDKDEKADMNKRTPKHNWASHPADGLRTMAFFSPSLFSQPTRALGGF